MNKQRLRINFVISTTLAVIFGTAMTSTNSVWAANIDCPNAAPQGDFQVCNGTNNDDRMEGTAKQDLMFGLGGDDTMFGFARDDAMLGLQGDDTMSGGSGNDLLRGGAGNDNINGESGDDRITGDAGADILKGSSGNDIITHGNIDSGFTNPDGSKDDIDCGSGNDEAWINVSTDGDTAASNCETVHTGILNNIAYIT